MNDTSTSIEKRFNGANVHVIGLGAYGTGREVALTLFSLGAVVTVSDVKPAEELANEIEALKDTGITIQTGGEAYRGIERAELVVPSPGVPLTIPPLLRAREHGAIIASEIEVAYWIAHSPIIAVTGTKGKSTTTSLIGSLLADEGKKVRVGGNIGRPLIALADQASPEEILVAEVSSFQLEATREFRPAVAVLLNLLPDHLDRHGTMADYAAAKARLFANERDTDTTIINRDDPQAWGMREHTRGRVVPFRLLGDCPDGADVVDGWLRVSGRRVCRQAALRLRGRHNLANALAALAAAEAAGASLDLAEDTLSRFEGLEHRLEVAVEVEGILFVNDSQATMPEASIVALESFPEHVILIAGGRPKVRDFGRLAETIAKRGADLVVIGEAADEIAAAARACGVENLERAGSLQEAVTAAYRKAKAGDVVLLSPACASFDMFSNMAERGRRFKQMARSLGQKERTP